VRALLLQRRAFSTTPAAKDNPMNKLKLTLDELQVTSFATADAASAERGTILGNAATRRCVETEGFCPQTGASPECEVTLAQTCVGTCTCETQMLCPTDFC
jgi:hypothetical protein